MICCAAGPQHDVETLSSVLAGDMLASWQEQADSLQAEGR